MDGLPASMVVIVSIVSRRNVLNGRLAEPRIRRGLDHIKTGDVLVRRPALLRLKRTSLRRLACSLAIVLLLSGGFLAIQGTLHAVHHAHHHAATHASAFCAWLCAAGQAVEAAAGPLMLPWSLAGILDASAPVFLPPSERLSPYEIRGPPPPDNPSR